MLKTAVKDHLLAEFFDHLAKLGISANTLKNYSSDISVFLNWFLFRLKTDGVAAETFSESLPFLSAGKAHEFKSFLANRHSAKTVNRRLASLRSLSRFLIERSIIENDFMENVHNLGATTEETLTFQPLLDRFRKHLKAQKISENTAKNYLSDVRHFLQWLEGYQL